MKVRENEKPSAQHSLFLKMFKQLRLEIGLKDALVEMPNQTNVLSSLLRNKEEAEEIASTTVTINHLFDEMKEDVEIKNSNVSDEPVLLNTPLSDKNSLEKVNDVDQEEKEFDLEDILQIQDVILREKLLNVHRLISNIESLKVNPTPDRVFKSLSSFPIPVMDSGSFFEESDTSLSHLDNSLPEFETFSNHTEETRSGKGLISVDNSNEPLLELLEFELFHFDLSFPRPPPELPDVEICLHFKPDAPVIDNFNELNEDQRGSEIIFLQNVEDYDSFTFVIRTFLPFLTYPKASPLSCSTGSEDTIFDPDIIPFPSRAGGIFNGSFLF
ncbi:hypothetical protein Tco_0573800 [Tanacetum coccineum]